MLTMVHSEKIEVDPHLRVNYNLILRAAGWNFQSDIRFCAEGAALITADSSFESETEFTRLSSKPNEECHETMAHSINDI